MHLLHNDHEPHRSIHNRFSQQEKGSLFRPLYVVVLFLIGIITAGCVISPPASSNATTKSAANATVISNTVALPDTFNGAVADLSNYILPSATPTTTAKGKTSVVINTGGSRANIRSGPGTNFPIVAKVAPGTAFTVVSKSQDETWWQICCVAPSSLITGTKTTTGTAWVASSVVKVAGADDGVVISERLLNPDSNAQWSVDWKCASERCQVKQCSAAVNAKAGRVTNQSWLSVEHQVTWNDTCFATDSWVFEVDQYTGKERTGAYADNFLYSYWRGKQPGQPNGVYTLEDGRAIAVWCSGPYKVQVEEGDGWTTAYEGNTCHDVRTGMIVLLSYNKRWLFTGKYQGQSYDHAYFGDSETLEQKLTNTNINLFWVQKKP